MSFVVRHPLKDDYKYDLFLTYFIIIWYIIYNVCFGRYFNLYFYSKDFSIRDFIRVFCFCLTSSLTFNRKVISRFPASDVSGIVTFTTLTMLLVICWTSIDVIYLIERFSYRLALKKWGLLLLICCLINKYNYHCLSKSFKLSSRSTSKTRTL